MNKGLIKTNELSKLKAKNKWEEINSTQKYKCCRCNKLLSLDNFREIEKNKYNYKKYNSFCNLCDAKRTAVYKNKKIQTIDGKVSFLFNNISRRTRDKKLELDFDKEYLIELYNKQNGKCYYSNEFMHLGNHESVKNLYNINFHNISVDRIDSSLGYIKENVVLCCWGINNMKQQLTKEQLVFWAEKLFLNKDKILNYGT